MNKHFLAAILLAGSAVAAHAGTVGAATNVTTHAGATTGSSGNAVATSYGVNVGVASATAVQTPRSDRTSVRAVDTSDHRVTLRSQGAGSSATGGAFANGNASGAAWSVP